MQDRLPVLADRITDVNGLDDRGVFVFEELVI
jgi:hypothetical protein